MNSFKTPQGTELPLLVLKGKNYLQVAHRLVWFREEKPHWAIETELLTITDKSCIARAVVKDEQGRVIATAHKSETISGFPDFIEKSETGATGRALALCGYGTQFTDDLDEGDRLADSPLSTKHGPRPIVPEQPTHQDGVLMERSYKVSFGKWSQRTLEEIHRTHGGDAIADYMDDIKETAKKKSQPITGQAAEFILNATLFLQAIEGYPPAEPGSDL